MMAISDPEPTGPFEWAQEPWGRALRCTRLAAPHLFTSRDLQLRDDHGEWTAVAASLGVAPDQLLLVKQVHGIQAAVAGRGRTVGWARPEADIIVTDDPHVAIGVRVADCAPVLLFDPARNAVGAVHAGWRGAAAAAAAAGVLAMTREFQTRPADVIAAIGPCLGQCCGEVGPEVVEAFRAGGAGAASIEAWFRPARAIDRCSISSAPTAINWSARACGQTTSSDRGCARRRITIDCTRTAPSATPQAVSWRRFAAPASGRRSARTGH